MSHDQHNEHTALTETECSSCKKDTRCPLSRTAGDFVACEHCGNDVHLGTTLVDWLEDTARDTSTTGKKFDQGKTEFHLMPVQSLETINKVLMYGAQKYGAENWRNVDNHEPRYYNAAMRHMQAWLNNEVIDPESGLPHLAHAICSLIFLIEREV